MDDIDGGSSEIRLMQLWGHMQRQWGYEIRADYIDGSNRIYNEVFTFPKEPESEEIDAAVKAALVRLHEISSYEPSSEVAPEQSMDETIDQAKVDLYSALCDIQTQLKDIDQKLADQLADAIDPLANMLNEKESQAVSEKIALIQSDRINTVGKTP